jgi:hypothetical protein
MRRSASSSSREGVQAEEEVGRQQGVMGRESQQQQWRVGGRLGGGTRWTSEHGAMGWSWMLSYACLSVAILSAWVTNRMSCSKHFELLLVTRHPAGAHTIKTVWGSCHTLSMLPLLC